MIERLRGGAVLGAWLGALVLLGCGSTPPTDYYTLGPGPSARPARTPKYPVRVAVEEVAVAAEYRTDRIIYRPSPYELGYYNYARWAVPPEVLVRRAVIERAAASGLFAEVDEAAALRSPDYTVHARLARLEEEDETEERWFGRVALRLELRDRDGGRVLDRSYDRRVPAGARTPLGVVKAISQAVGEVIGEFLAAADEALARRKPR